MLSLRFAVVAGLCAVALWGLFSLLENLREPELLRSARAVVVKGCDPIGSEEAQQLCPQLFCQKALLDARAVPLRSRMNVTLNQGNVASRLIGVATEGDQQGLFACVLEHNKVVAARAVTQPELDALAGEDSGWMLGNADE